MSIYYLVNGDLSINVAYSSRVGLIEKYCTGDMETIFFRGYVF